LMTFDLMNFDLMTFDYIFLGLAPLHQPNWIGVSSLTHLISINPISLIALNTPSLANPGHLKITMISFSPYL